MISSRMDESRLFIELRDLGEQSRIIDLTDEVLVYYDRFGLENGKSFRVAGRSLRGADNVIDISGWA